MKKCNKCKLEKEYSEFHKASKEKDGYRHSCRDCTMGHKVHIKPIKEKKCKKCSIIKPIEEFGFANRRKDFRTTNCRKCINKYKHELRMLNPKAETLRKRKIDLRTKYNTTIEEYNKMYDEQNGKCKTCPREYNGTLHLDHCHTTGKVRGLLCSKCNHTLGMVGDNVEILKNLINYLKESNTNKSENYTIFP